MLKIYPYETLGHADHGWLNARHHFSFADYYNPDRTHFGVLRVINDDVIRAGAGFDMHPHRDMEIITYVRKGAITHRDNLGNEGRTAAGDVQVMSAGKGIFHSEYNLEEEDTNLYQVWIEPNRKAVQPRWETRQFSKTPADEALTLLVSGDGDAPLFIHQDARIYAGVLPAGHTIKHPVTNQAYILVSGGMLEMDGEQAKKGDGIEVIGQPSVTITSIEPSELLVIDVPV